MERISLHRDECGINDSWFVEHVTIDHEDERHVHFPLSRWLPPNQPMEFIKFDSDLPQVIKAKDPSLYEQRSKELDRKKTDFACEPLLKRVGMPRTVSFIQIHLWRHSRWNLYYDIEDFISCAAQISKLYNK